MLSETARSQRLHRLAKSWAERAELLRRIEVGFDHFGNAKCSQLARELRLEILQCRDELRAAMYPIYLENYAALSVRESEGIGPHEEEKEHKD